MVKKSIFKHWWFWGGVIILFCLAVFTVLTIIGDNKKGFVTRQDVIINKINDESAKSFSDSELQDANEALKKGIKINDPKQDWYSTPPNTKQPDGRYDNSSPYPLDWTDIKSLSVGADNNYIYFKFQFWGDFPKEATFYNGDFIEAASAKVQTFTFSKNNGQKDQAVLMQSVWYCDIQEKTKPGKDLMIDQYAMISPNGIDKEMDTTYNNITSVGLIEGGQGTDYFLSAYPLSLFNLKLGDEVSFDVAYEVGSNKFHHEAIDIILNKSGSKFGNTINYILGSNNYKAFINTEGYKK